MNIWDKLKDAGKWIVKNKEAIGGTCLVISKVLPDGTIVHSIFLVIGTALTIGGTVAAGHNIVKTVKNKRTRELSLNGNKTTVGNIILSISEWLSHNIWIGIGLLGLIIIIVGIIHKYIKGELDNTLPKKAHYKNLKTSVMMKFNNKDK